MLPPSVIVGVNFRRTPNSFQTIVTAPSCPPCTTGKGNSPPARKDASWPGRVSRFGSERLLNSDRKSTRLNSSHLVISYAVFCLKKKKKKERIQHTKPQANMTTTEYMTEHVLTPHTTTA